MNNKNIGYQLFCFSKCILQSVYLQFLHINSTKGNMQTALLDCVHSNTLSVITISRTFVFQGWLMPTPIQSGPVTGCMNLQWRQGYFDPLFLYPASATVARCAMKFKFFSWQVPPTWTCTGPAEGSTSRWSTLEQPAPLSCWPPSAAGWPGCSEPVPPWWSVRADTAWSCRLSSRCWRWSRRPDASCPSTSPPPTVEPTQCPSMHHPQCDLISHHTLNMKPYCPPLSFVQREDSCRSHKGHPAGSAAPSETTDVCWESESRQHRRVLWAGSVWPQLHSLHPAGR